MIYCLFLLHRPGHEQSPCWPANVVISKKGATRAESWWLCSVARKGIASSSRYEFQKLAVQGLTDGIVAHSTKLDLMLFFSFFF
jgi:hypothetical protein